MAMSVPMRRVHELAKNYDETLRADDPRFNFCVRILHEEGSTFWFENAFLMKHGEFVIVFSEHQGFHVFAVEDLLHHGQYIQQTMEPEFLE